MKIGTEIIFRFSYELSSSVPPLTLNRGDRLTVKANDKVQSGELSESHASELFSLGIIELIGDNSSATIEERLAADLNTKLLLNTNGIGEVIITPKKS